MKTLKLLIIVILILALHSCKPGHLDGDASPCHDFSTNYEKANEIYKSFLPYKGSDTLIFADTANILYTFVGTGITDSNFVCYDDVYAPVCPPDKKCFEYYEYLFNETTAKSNLNIRLYERFHPPYSYDISYHQMVIKFKTASFYSNFTFIGDKTSPRYYASLNFGNKTFYDLTKIYLTPPTTDTNSYLFINKTDGIVFVKINEEKFTLIK